MTLRDIAKLEFKDSEVRKRLDKIKRKKQLITPQVIKAVYKAFKPNTHYTTREVDDLITPILIKYGIKSDGRGNSRDIWAYFYGEFKTGTRRAGRYELGDRKFGK